MDIHTLQRKANGDVSPSTRPLSSSRNVKYSRNLNLHAKDEGEKFPASQVLSKFLEAKQKVSGIFAGGMKSEVSQLPQEVYYRINLLRRFTP